MIATGVGSMPGDDAANFAESIKTVLGELPDLPYLPELPGRGIVAGMVGRGLAVVSGLGIDLQPAGWRLTDASGVDHRRAVSLLSQDLDALEELTEGYTGAFKAQVAGPWTLAATVEKPRGDKVLSDVGARRELAQALAEGIGEHVRGLRRRLPGVDRLVVQVDEPSLAAVAAGGIRTASGFGRHRTIHPPEMSESLGWVLSAISSAGAEPWVHSCAPATPLGLVRGAGALGLSVDSTQLDATDHEVLAEALEAGETVALGVVPSMAPEASEPGDTELTEGVLRWLDMLGLDPDLVGSSVVLSPTCGLAGATPAWSRRALQLARTSADNLS